MEAEVVEQILQEVAERITNEDDLTNFQKGTAFENYVYQLIKEVGKEYTDPENITQTGTQSFPDIIIDGSGIEVKYTKDRKWQITGNSIFQGTVVQNLKDDVYVFFGKKRGTGIDVRWNEYSKSLSDIKVTHSPRFLIDMEIHENSSQTIFEKLDIEYNDFRELDNEDKVSEIKKFVSASLREGEKLWWLDSYENGEGITPKISEYKTLSAREQDKLRQEALVFFPEIFSNEMYKFTGATSFFLAEYQVINSALRDIFTAGGKKTISVRNENIKVSQVYSHLYENAPFIQNIIATYDLEIFKEYSPNLNLEGIADRQELEDRWLQYLDTIGVFKAFDVATSNEIDTDLQPSDIYRAGL